MKRWTWALAVAVGAVGCNENPKQEAAPRAEIRTLGGSTMEVVPTAGQLPYCLLFTMSEKGIIRQLTMTRENRSIKCEAGRPIANRSFRVPQSEGKVRTYIFFSSERIQAGPVAQQLFDLKDKPRISAMDMRLPGRVFVETLEFTPEPDETPLTGGVVDSSGQLEGAPGEAQAEGAAAPAEGATAPAEGAAAEGATTNEAGAAPPAAAPPDSATASPTP